MVASNRGGCGLLLIGGLVLTESRAGIIAAAVMALLTALGSRHKFRALAVLGVVALVLLNFGPASLRERFRSIKVSGEAINSDEGSSRLHVELLKAGVYMIEAHPVFGVGAGRFKEVAPLYNPEISKLIRGSYIAHNTFMQLGAECGLPELLLFLAMLGYAIYNLTVGQHTHDELLSSLCVAVRISLIGISVAALTQTTQLLPFWIPIFFSQSLLEIAKAQPELSASKSGSELRAFGSVRSGSENSMLSPLLTPG